MEIKVHSHSKRLPEFIKQTAYFYAKELGIHNSKYNITIMTNPTLKADGNNGLCAKTGDREISIALYSRLSMIRLLYTLAHEMVHAKQIARGQYKSEYKRGTFHHYWMGKRVKAEYLNRPWEREAFSRESILVEVLSEHVTKNMKKKNKKH
jgi:hypothetical protein